MGTNVSTAWDTSLYEAARRIRVLVAIGPDVLVPGRPSVLNIGIPDGEVPVAGGRSIAIIVPAEKDIDGIQGLAIAKQQSDVILAAIVPLETMTRVLGGKTCFCLRTSSAQRIDWTLVVCSEATRDGVADLYGFSRRKAAQ